MNWIYENLAESSALTASSTKTGYDISSIQNYHLSKPFAFDGNSGNIVINLGSAVEVKNFFVAGTNLTDSATVTLEANSSDVWTSPPYSASLEIYDNAYIGLQEIDQTYQYWRLVISDSTVPDVKLGYMIIGDHLQLPGIDPGVELNYNNTTAVQFSVTQQTYADTGIDYFSSSFNFPVITDYSYQIDGKDIATRFDLLEFWYVNKAAKPILMIIFEGAKDKIPPMMGMIAQNTMKFKLDSSHGYYSMKFDFVETK